LSDVTTMERQIAKGCVFGAIFGVSAPEMAIRLHISEQQATKYLDSFFSIFSSIDSFIKRQHDTVLTNNVIYIC